MQGGGVLCDEDSTAETERGGKRRWRRLSVGRVVA